MCESGDGRVVLLDRTLYVHGMSEAVRRFKNRLCILSKATYSMLCEVALCSPYVTFSALCQDEEKIVAI